MLAAIHKAVAFARRNPKSTIAGLAAIATALVSPGMTPADRITGIAAGLGLIFCADAQ